MKGVSSEMAGNVQPWEWNCSYRQAMCSTIRVEEEKVCGSKIIYIL